MNKVVKQKNATLQMNEVS